MSKLRTRPYSQVPNEFIRSPHVSGPAKLVFGVLNSYNPSFPSLDSLCSSLHLGKKTVRNAIGELVSLNVLSVQSGRKSRKSNQYLVHDWAQWNWNAVLHGTSSSSIGNHSVVPIDPTNKNKGKRTNKENKQISNNLKPGSGPSESPDLETQDTAYSRPDTAQPASSLSANTPVSRDQSGNELEQGTNDYTFPIRIENLDVSFEDRSELDRAIGQLRVQLVVSGKMPADEQKRYLYSEYDVDDREQLSNDQALDYFCFLTYMSDDDTQVRVNQS